MDQVGVCHDLYLHRNANEASAKFASRCNRALHQNAHNGGMNAVQEERDRLRLALVRFYNAAKEGEPSGSIPSVNAWAKESFGISPSTINPVINGTANKRLEEETYFKLAYGASKLLSRVVTVEELKGELDRNSAAPEEAAHHQQKVAQDSIPDVVKKALKYASDDEASMIIALAERIVARAEKRGRRGSKKSAS